MPTTPEITPTPRLIDILAFPDVQLLDVAGPLQVFASANEWARESGLPPPYRTRVIAQASPVVTNSGLALLAEPLPPAGVPLDTRVVAGGSGVRRACEDPTLLRWIARRAPRARRVVAICTGALLAAAAGLLEGRRAVTHWRACEELARRHPSTRVEVDPIFLRDGMLWTSAGVSAGIDLSLALVEEDVGHRVAMAVARDLVVFLRRPGGQSQFSRVLALHSGDDVFERLHGWILEHLDADLGVGALAARAGMSERTFLRRYRAATGQSPARAVEGLRIEAAQRLLSGSALPLKTIARRCGFSSEETLRQVFRRRIKLAPRDFRARFAARAAPGVPRRAGAGA